jgi:periplasmic divalent cation tolerance protein
VTGPVVAFSTAGSVEDAERIALALVEKGVAACVNVVPGVVSVYRWKGKVERSAEALLVIKSRGERFEDLEAALLGAHLYEVPELVAFSIGDGYEPYLEWLMDSVAVAAPAPAAPAPASRRRPAPAPGRPPGRPRPRSRR